jgi:hypothetical protein
MVEPRLLHHPKGRAFPALHATMNTPPEKDPLDSLLDRWNDVPRLAPGLRGEVWRKLSSSQEAAPVWQRIEALFGTRGFAYAFVCACLLGGLFAAELRLSQLHRERGKELAKAYVRLIDPTGALQNR